MDSYGRPAYRESMDDPLWTERHRPAVADLPQAEVRAAMERALAEPVNLVLHGPPGAGKTAAVRALAHASHAEPDSDFTVINVADFFDRTKTEIRNDPRFARFLQGQTAFSKRSSGTRTRYKRDWSKAKMVSHVIREHAGYAPAGGDYRTLLLDNAETAREDFQQALRRTMERHHETTQFVLATRRASALIPAIRSRCLSVPVRAPTVDETVAVLRDVCGAEDVAYEPAGLEYVATYADGNLREALLAAQTTATEADEVTRATAYEALQGVGHDETVAGMIDDALAGEFDDARDALDELLFDEGLSGEEVLDELLTVARGRLDGRRLARLYARAGDVDHDLATGTTARVHLAGLLAALGVEDGDQDATTAATAD